MKIPEHITLSFLLAQFAVQPEYGGGGTALMIAAGCLPDLDGLTLVAGWRFYKKYHRRVGHGVPMTLLGPLSLALIGSYGLGLGPFWPLWAWLQLSLLLHLLTDVVFYRWPVELLWPLSRRGWEVGLLTWNDLVPTVILYLASTAVILVPDVASWAAASGLGCLVLYLGWRAWRPPPETGWPGWLAGGWAQSAPPIWKWLTGDFVT